MCSARGWTEEGIAPRSGELPSPSALRRKEVTDPPSELGRNISRAQRPAQCVFACIWKLNCGSLRHGERFGWWTNGEARRELCHASPRSSTQSANRASLRSSSRSGRVGPFCSVCVWGGVLVIKGGIICTSTYDSHASASASSSAEQRQKEASERARCGVWGIRSPLFEQDPPSSCPTILPQSGLPPWK